jgi:predicted transposase/invertase (TIGR01784 family)
MTTLTEKYLYSPNQIDDYDGSLKVYRDLQNSLDTAKDEGYNLGIEAGIELGKEEGIELGLLKGKYEITNKLLKLNLPIEFIIESTGFQKKKLKG